MTKSKYNNEFIGKKTIAEYCNCVIEGTVIDETKNLIIIKTNNQIKKIIKKNAVFTIDGEKIKGTDIIKRPEDRIKK
ncbi:MAG: ribonuclease P protein subunit [archaeon]